MVVSWEPTPAGPSGAASLDLHLACEVSRNSAELPATEMSRRPGASAASWAGGHKKIMSARVSYWIVYGARPLVGEAIAVPLLATRPIGCAREAAPLWAEKERAEKGRKNMSARLRQYCQLAPAMSFAASRGRRCGRPGALMSWRQGPK